ncbi:hypothetical protein [Azospirillum sp. BE72]|uniref:hypothetical protein n=1 Tax=Azospirillum sp. BE72 TaxID=2817776 RepID=UPI00286450AB|nr:hypothetical protein [Azospirillum sp. BE72]MDR6775468.1 hypothetical protein [Azospirillum sp. BE72]
MKNVRIAGKILGIVIVLGTVSVLTTLVGGLTFPRQKGHRVKRLEARPGPG